MSQLNKKLSLLVLSILLLIFINYSFASTTYAHLQTCSGSTPVHCDGFNPNPPCNQTDGAWCCESGTTCGPVSGCGGTCLAASSSGCSAKIPDDCDHVRRITPPSCTPNSGYQLCDSSYYECPKSGDPDVYATLNMANSDFRNELRSCVINGQSKLCTTNYKFYYSCDSADKVYFQEIVDLTTSLPCTKSGCSGTGVSLLQSGTDSSWSGAVEYKTPRAGIPGSRFICWDKTVSDQCGGSYVWIANDYGYLSRPDIYVVSCVDNSDCPTPGYYCDNFGNWAVWQCQQAPPPVVETTDAANVTGDSVTLKGTVNPNHVNTTAWFRYSSQDPGSCNDTFGTRVPATSADDVSIGSGSTAVAFSKAISGLSAGTSYYYCAIASNGATKSYGSVLNFKTFDYTLISGNITLTQGYSGTTTITATLPSLAATLPVSFSVSGLPAGASAAFSPTACNPTCTTTMTIYTNGFTTPAGSYPMTVTGTPLSRTTSFTLTVQAQTLSVVLGSNPPSGFVGAPVSISADIDGTATGPITYRFWWNCINTSTNAAVVIGACGDSAVSTNGAIFSGVTDDPKAVSHTYPVAGSYTAKVIVDRGSAPSTEARITIPISANPPEVTTLTPENVQLSPGNNSLATATLKATINPKGVTTRGYFKYHKKSTPGVCGDSNFLNSITTGLQIIGSQSTPQTMTESNYVFYPVGIPYHVCAIAYNDNGETTYGNVVTFNTPAKAPTITTNTVPSYDIFATGAFIGSRVDNPSNVSLTTWYRYHDRSTPGTCDDSDSFGIRVPATGGNTCDPVISGCHGYNDLIGVGNLTPQTKYYFCGITENVGGKVASSNVESFTTKARANLVANQPSISFSAPAVGQAITFSSNFTNNGGVHASGNNLRARFCIDNPDCLNSTTGLVGGDIGNIFGCTTTGGLTACGSGLRPGDISNQLTSSSWVATTTGSHTAFFCADVWKQVTESDEGDNCTSLTFTVSAQSLNATLSFSPPSGPSFGTSPAPFNTTLLSDVSGTTTGPITYAFWWNCSSASANMAEVISECGHPADATYGAKFDNVTITTKSVAHTYLAAGTYTGKVIVTRGSAPAVEKRATITISAPPLTVTGVSGKNPQVVSGGKQITINGTGFVSGATVTIGGTAASGVSFVSASQLTATAPAKAAGSYDVVVTNSDGKSGTCTNCLRYIDPPIISSVSPSKNLDPHGGQTVTSTGFDLKVGSNGVKVDTAFANTAGSDTSVTFTTPAHPVGGEVTLRIYGDQGTDDNGIYTDYSFFTYNIVPTPTPTPNPSLSVVLGTINGLGGGSVTSNPVGISCQNVFLDGSDCSESYTPGIPVTLTAFPGLNSAFHSWSGSCSGTSPTTTVTMDANKTCTAKFAFAYRLNVTRAGNGSGTVTSSPEGITCGTDCTQFYADTTVVTITAAPASGSSFTGWSGDADCSDGIVTMSGDRTCTATFQLPPPTPTPTPLSKIPPCAGYGDVTLDGLITQDDSTWISQHIAGTRILTNNQKIRADVSGDNNITSDDVTKMQGYLAGTVANFVVCQPITISSISLSNILKDAATISWKTSYPGSHKIIYGTSRTALTQTVQPDQLLGTTHALTIPGLQPAKLYFYKVQSENGAGLTTSPLGVFRTKR